MFGFLALLYNTICGTAAASDSLVKYQQGQRNLKDALDKGEMVYYDGKGIMRTTGGSMVFRERDKNGHDCLINQENGAVIRDFTEEKREAELAYRKERDAEKKQKYLDLGMPYWKPTAHFDKYHDRKFDWGGIKGEAYTIEGDFEEMDSGRRYCLKTIKWLAKRQEGTYSFPTTHTSTPYCGVDKVVYCFYYKQYYTDQNCTTIGWQTPLTHQEYLFWGGANDMQMYRDMEDVYEHYRQHYPPYIDVEADKREMNKMLKIKQTQCNIDG